MRIIIIIVIVVAMDLVVAQGARSMAMGGVLLPDSAASSYNPAYLAFPAGLPTTVELPLGAFNLIALARDLEGENFVEANLFGLLDQVTHLNTYIFSLPATPKLDELDLEIDYDNGIPSVRLILDDAVAHLLPFNETSFGVDFALPLNFGSRNFRVGVRPYVLVSGSYTPDADLRKLLTEGTSAGSLEFSGVGEAGVALDVIYASAVPTDDPNMDIYVGVRTAPYLGFFRTDISGKASLVVSGPQDDPQASYDYRVDTFVSNSLGYGVAGDVGLVLTSRDDSGGTFTFGLGLRNLGIGFWNGLEERMSDNTSLSGSSSQQLSTEVSSNVAQTDTQRTTYNTGLSVIANGGYRFQVAPLIRMLVAADVAFKGNSFASHLGVETLFGVDDELEVAARAGLGFDNGLVFGLGTGFETSGFSIDIALSAHSRLFGTGQSFGLVTSMSF